MRPAQGWRLAGAGGPVATVAEGQGDLHDNGRQRQEICWCTAMSADMRQAARNLPSRL